MAERRVIDLRSDTVTLPSVGMRRAIAEAEVGDDVFGEDPTVRQLETMAADRAGKEAAVYVPSGTMANLVAVMTHCQRGEEMIAGSEAHVIQYEAAGASGVASVMPRTVTNGPHGEMPLHEVEGLMRGENVHLPRTALLWIENTHNRCGGAVTSVEQTQALADVARRHGARVHIDGARIFNAALALNTTVSALAESADSMSFCLSKGLGAPVGSLLCGDGEFIGRARKNRKMLGGGMRQAGIIAAAGVYALSCMVDRLAEDHANAKMLARGLASLPIVDLDAGSVATNIVIFRVADSVGFMRGLKRAGVLCTSPGPGRVRMVTHFGIDSADIEEALERTRHAVATLA